MEAEEFLDREELATFLNVDKRTISRWMSLGLLPRKKLKGKTLFKKRDILGWLKDEELTTATKESLYKQLFSAKLAKEKEDFERMQHFSNLRRIEELIPKVMKDKWASYEMEKDTEEVSETDNYQEKFKRFDEALTAQREYVSDMSNSKNDGSELERYFKETERARIEVDKADPILERKVEEPIRKKIYCRDELLKLMKQERKFLFKEV